ncbi:MAG: hydrogenase iron-sulfur subunit, partial [Archaeoglobi archaeon]|nr:hydrogenase iron-sulfur subunit [Archaeoglobi archaeon]
KGIFLAGTASGPKDIQDSVASAGLAAAKAMELIVRGQAEFDPYNAYVDQDKCIGCGVCVSVCNFNAAFMKGKKAKIDPNACVMCGVCVASCPADAIDMGFFKEEAIVSAIDALAEEKSMEPLVLAFACHYCSYGAADLAGTTKVQYEPNIRIIRTLCSGRVDPEWILRALKKGIDGVIVSGCRLGECHFKVGNYHAKDRVEAIKKALEEVGINPERVTAIWHSAGEASGIAEDFNNFVEKLRELGPIEEEVRRNG